MKATLPAAVLLLLGMVCVSPKNSFAQSVTVEVQRTAPEVLVSWDPVEDAMHYTVEAGDAIGSLTGTVAILGTRYGEAPLAEGTRFYRIIASVDAPRARTARIHVDQFGYLPAARKVAVISDPQVGFNADESFVPGAVLQVCRAPDGTPVFTNSPVAWNGGATHSNSGDRVWWLDFSPVTHTGNYFIHDPSNGVVSFTFRIADNVYDEVLNQAARTFYYQRCGTAKSTPCAEPAWTDDTPCHLANDAACLLVTNPIAGTARDLTGGWHDAGDYNKYVNFADKAVHDLLAAYEQNRDTWHDHSHIPESGNGIPDVLDEVKYELDWLLKMQLADGSVLHKVCATNWGHGSPPGADTIGRRYAPPTASATISGCGVFAHAAVVYATRPEPALQAYAATLSNAAVTAWGWLEAHPGRIPSVYDNEGFAPDAAEDGPYFQEANRISAAAYLFAATGDTVYRDFFDAGYTNVNLMQWHYIYSSEVEYQDALIYYANLSNATATVAADITNAYVDAAQKMLAHHRDGDDAYRAWIDAYYWGSNEAKSDNGNMMHSMLVYGWDPARHTAYRDAAAAYVHYLHGVNPLGLVYLSNMRRNGAEASVPEFYHQWFADGTDWDSAETSLYGPAPGYVVGGANPNYAPDPAYVGPPIEPPQNQPAQKSYRSWNADWPENSWELTENAIYCQSAYLKLLSKLTSSGAP